MLKKYMEAVKKKKEMERSGKKQTAKVGK